jgi:CheY-like chemotaxis protein
MAGPSLDQARPHLETLGKLMAKGSGLLRQMLAYAGRGRPSVRTLDCNQLVEELAHLLGTSISKKAQLRLELHPGPLWVSADPCQLQQVVMNLVINASEALGDRNGVITLATRPEHLDQETIDSLFKGQGLRPGPHLSLRVEDNGAGMAAEVLEKIFDPFFTTKFTGRGLGLAAVRGIVRGHRGGIRVASEPGQGCVFTLLFPAVPAPPPGAEAVAAGPAVTAAAGTVLVVDDEDEMRAVAVLALDQAGFQTLQARDGLEALDLLQRHPDRVALIVMDLTMPVMDGEETCRELRRRGVATPILLTSGFDEAEVMGRLADLGLAGFLQKPFRLAELVARARRALAG